MITLTREEAQQVLDALQKIYIAPEHEEYIQVWWPACEQAIETLRTRLAQPERKWQGLTDEEYEATAEKYVTNCYFDTLKYARAIEAKLKAKNGF